METPEKLKYHQAALDLIEYKPVFSAEAIQQIREFEERHSIKLPPSVKEWYSLADAVELLRQYSNQDHPEPIEGLEISQRDIKMHDGTIYPQGKLLLFMGENQGVTVWYVFLNGSDDPPVFFSDYSLENIYRIDTRKFSDFVYTRIWDFSKFYAYPNDEEYNLDPELVGHFNQEVGEEVLDYFRSVLIEEPDFWINDYYSMTQGDTVCYRFHKENNFLLICINVESSNLPYWEIWAKSGPELLELLQIMRACPYATEWEDSQWVKTEEDLAKYFY